MDTCKSLKFAGTQDSSVRAETSPYPWCEPGVAESWGWGVEVFLVGLGAHSLQVWAKP